MRRLTTPVLAGALLALSASLAATSLQLPGSAVQPAAELELLPGLPAPAGAAADPLFNSGFETVALVWQTSHYDDLPEQFMGTSFDYQGVHYRDLNMVSGVYPGPGGSAFGPGGVAVGGLGNQFIIEDAGLLYDDFPDFGSPPNGLNPGDLMFPAPGPNLSLGALASMWMDLDQPAFGVQVELVYYENGPWHNIEITLEGYRDGKPVTDTRFQLLSDDLDGRDNIGYRTLSLPAGVMVDQLHLHSRKISDGVYTAPRIMLDNLQLRVLRQPLAW